MSEEEEVVKQQQQQQQQQKPKKKTFVEPSFEGEIAEDALAANQYLNTRLEDEDDTSNYFDKVGCYVPDTKNIPWVDQELGTEYLEHAAKNKATQLALDPNLTASSSRLGIIGGDARFKSANQLKVSASVPLSAKMLKLDHDVCETLCSDNILPEGSVPIPSVLITDTDPEVVNPLEARVYRHLHGTDTCKKVAIVPLTSCIISFVPHGKDMQQRWEDLTHGGMATKETHPKHHILPESVRRQIDQLDRDADEDEGVEARDIIYSIALEPGSIFVTHRGMPVAIEGSIKESDDDDEDGERLPFIVKTIAFEVPSKGSKRRNLTEQAIETGYYTANQLHENFYYKTLPVLKDGAPKANDENIYTMPRATKDDVPWLFRGRKKAATKVPKKLGTPSSSSDQKKPVEKRPRVEKEEEEEDDTKRSKVQEGESPSPSPPPAGEEEIDSSLPPKGKKKKRDRSPSLSPPLPPAGEEGEKKSKKKSDPSKEREVRMNAAKAKHNNLKEMIDALDKRVWKKSLADNALEKETAVDEAHAKGELKANLVRKYEDALNTLEGKIKEATDGQNELPKIEDLFQTMDNILKGVEEILPPAAKHETKMLKSKRAQLEKFKQIEDELHKHVKKISEHLTACQKLEESAKERVASLTKKAPTAANEEVPELPDLPSVDVDTLSPYVIVGKKNIHIYMKDAKIKDGILADATKAFDNDHARHLLKEVSDSYSLAMSDLKELFKITPEEDYKTMSFDFARHYAYSNALEATIELLDTHKTAVAMSHIPSNNKKGGKSKADRVQCRGCDEFKINFAESGYCNVCFVECKAQGRHNKIEDRVVQLQDMAEREEELMDGIEGPDQKKWDTVQEMYETYTKASEDFLENPNKRSWDVYSKIYEEMDKILPELDGSDGEDEYDDEEEEESGDYDEDASAPPKPVKKGEHEGILSLKNLPDDEEEASFSDSSDEREYAPSRKRERPQSGLSDRALKTMKAIRVLPVWEKIVARYSDATKHALLDAYLDELQEDTKYTYSIKVKSVREEEKEMVGQHHTHFLTQEEAMAKKMDLTVPGENVAIVARHEVKF